MSTSATSVERMLFPGAAGDIETLIESPSAAPVAVAICCHPHPLFGGSMINKVIHTVAKAFLAADAVAIRFNFRGVGASAGVHDEGRGEIDDVIALAKWARERWPDLPLWLGGFSFGAWIVLRAPVSPALLVTVAPPVGRWDFSKISPPQSPWLVIQGDRDDLVDANTVEQWVRASGASSVLRLAEADHFFHARLHEIRDAVAAFVASAIQACSV